jgi:pimeloyl-ACP methyl ester carboxylesterase
VDQTHPIDPWQAELEDFRAAHTLQTRQIDGHAWEYFACGGGADLLLILPGGLAVADTAFRYIRRFESSYRIIAPTYPASATTMAQLVGGLTQLIGSQARVSVIGGSYSGLVAQCLVRHARARIALLELSDTGLPRPARARQFGRYQPWLRRLPTPLLRGMLRLGMALFLQPMTVNRAFWRRYFKARISSLTRAACVNHLATWRDFDLHYRFSAADLSGWPGRILLIEAEHDGLFRRPEQLALRQLYPDAQVHTFENSPHGASLARMDDYIALIAQFLSADSRVSGPSDRREHCFVEEHHESN